MGTILQATGICKQYEGTEILKGIDISIEEGEFVAVMGQSGSGKSTLLYSVSSMDRPSAGTVCFAGEDITKYSDVQMSNIRLKKMGFIFQHSCLLKTLSIRDNIVLPGYKAGQESRQQVNEHAEKLLRKTGIETIADHEIRKVSGGQLQRAAICRALINCPKLLFADEPTGALNRSMTEEVMDIISRINAEGTAVMLVTHDAGVAARADRVIFLKDGCIGAEKRLGRFQKAGRKERESELKKWLESQGF